MSKVVTIPDYTRPNWVCCINGVRYAYPAGSTQEVPDEVADLIEDQMEHLPVPDPAKPSGGVSSWNDLTDKPFYEETKVTEIPAINIEWDGNTEGREFLGDESNGFCKVSDDVFAESTIEPGWVVEYMGRDGKTQIFNKDNVSTDLEFYHENPMFSQLHFTNYGDEEYPVMIVTENLEVEGLTLKKGVYFEYSVDRYVQKLYLPGSTVTETELKTIEPKFLPENVATKDYIEKVILGGAW